MKATIIKTGETVNVTDLHNGYYLDKDSNPYRADELQLEADTDPDQHDVTIIIAGDNGTVRQTLEAIMFLVDQGQQRLRDLAECNSKQSKNTTNE